MGHTRLEFGPLDGRAGRGKIALGQGLADLQFTIAGHRRDMGQSQCLRVPFKTAELHLFRPYLNGEAKIA
ncbi:hypothetical protein GCM10011309_13620 [Litorimonas cladophorae]|uniref:Uncharacterized protein n=1 Tax=Litorimonas cladophorae TaxID=1220491 RepID=A0A918KK59_9PROT|nr:hypothetical protein GCM10011309_13620 [Litorimonas cladophorae]